MLAGIKDAYKAPRSASERCETLREVVEESLDDSSILSSMLSSMLSSRELARPSSGVTGFGVGVAIAGCSNKGKIY